MFTPRPLGHGAFATALTLAFLGAGSSVASAADRHIASTGTDGGDCVAAPCATLDYTQQQVQAGDTVRLAAGIYPVGDATFNVDDVTYERNGTGDAKITLPGDSYGLQVGGDDVTFRHLTVSSPDDTIQGDTWAFTYTGSGLTLDHMLVGHTSQGVVALGGQGITVTNSTFADINGTAVGVDSGHTTATDNDFSSGSGIFVTERATVTATGNLFRGTSTGGGTGIYVESGSAGGTVSGNRFSPNLEFGINSGQEIDAANNWWGCNEGLVTDGAENPGCVANYDLPAENAEPHLVLDVSADPNPFLITGSSTITTSLISSDPESTFVGGPTGTDVTLATTAGTLDDTLLRLASGSAQTTLHQLLPGVPVVTASLDNASVSTTVVADVEARVVSPDGSDSGDCIAEPCATLEYVQEQVQAGDTVRLAAGVYPVGNTSFNVDGVTYERTGPGEATITLPRDSGGIQVSAPDLTFRNLTVSSPDDTIQGETWGFTYTSSGLTLDKMLIHHLHAGVMFGDGITVTDSTFDDIGATAISLSTGVAKASRNVFVANGGIYVTEAATVEATNNDFRGNPAGDGGNGIYVDGGSAGGTATGNRFSPSLEFGINGGRAVNAANNWWGCNEGVEHDGCVGNYDLPAENAEPHLVLDVIADPNPFLTTRTSTVTTRLISSDPDSTFVGGPTGTNVALATTGGTLDDTLLHLTAGSAQTTLRNTIAESAVVTATLDNGSASTTFESAEPVVETRTVTPDGTDSGDCVAEACASLEYVQHQVSEGDTVQFAAGVYPLGDAVFDVDDVTYQRTGSGEVTITFPEVSYGFQVSGHGITFRNLTTAPAVDSPDEDIWAFTYSGSDLTLDTMQVVDVTEGVFARGGVGITVRDSVFSGIGGTAISVDGGQISVTDSMLAAGTGISVKDHATITATGNNFSGGHTGIYVESGSAGGTVTGSRFSPTLAYGIVSAGPIQAPNNWWGCNGGVGNQGCVENVELPAENAEPHLALTLTADPNPFLTTDSSTITASLTSSDPESTFVGGPIATDVTLATSLGALDDTQLHLVNGVDQTVLRHTVAGFPLVTATLDNATAFTTVEAGVPPIEQEITFTSTAPTDAAVGGTYGLTATGGESGNPVTFSVDESSTTDACTIDDATVSFTGAGTCTINANQAGDAAHTAAAQKQQSFTIAKAAQVITFTSTAPTDAKVGGTYDLSAAGGASDNPVTFTIDATSTAGACTVSDAAVSFTGAGQCVVNANQAGNANYTAANQEQQTIAVAPASVTSASLSPSSFAYDAVRVGTDAPPQSRTFTLTNTGNRDITVQAPSLTGANPADYAIVADTCTNAEIAPADTCTVAVRFSPTTVGETSAALRVAYGTGSDAVDADLTGTGLAKQEPNVIVPDGPGDTPTPPGGTTPPVETAPPAVLPLTLNAVRTPVRCVRYGATPKKRIALKADGQATIGWTIKKVRGQKALSKCPPARNDPKRTTVTGKAKGTGSVKTNATGSVSVALSTVLPAKVRKALKPGLYRVSFVARNATGASPARTILIRVLKRR